MKPNKGMFTVFLGPFPGFVSGRILVRHGHIIRQHGIHRTEVPSVNFVISHNPKTTISPHISSYFDNKQI